MIFPQSSLPSVRYDFQTPSCLRHSKPFHGGCVKTFWPHANMSRDQSDNCITVQSRVPYCCHIKRLLEDRLVCNYCDFDQQSKIRAFFGGYLPNNNGLRNCVRHVSAMTADQLKQKMFSFIYSVFRCDGGH